MQNCKRTVFPEFYPRGELPHLTRYLIEWKTRAEGFTGCAEFRIRDRESRKKNEYEKGWKMEREEWERDAKSPPRDPEDGGGEGRVMESEGWTRFA